MPFLAQTLTRATSSAAATLGTARFEAEFETGKHLSLQAALQLTLHNHSADTAAATDDAQSRSASARPKSPAWSPTA